MKSLRRWLKYWIARAVLALVAALPLELAVGLGALLGRLGFTLARKQRALALEHLWLAFPDTPEPERRRIARRAFANLGRVAAEVACVRQVERRGLVEFPEESLAVLRAAVDEGHGVVAACGHLDNWEFLGRFTVRAGFKATTAAKRSHDPRLTELLERLRGEGGLQVLWRGTPDIWDEIRAILARGEIFAALVDQDIRARGVFVDFFGKKAFTPSGPAQLAIETGAAVIAGTIERVGSVRHRLRMQRIPVTGDVTALTQAMTRALEERIRAHPDQWVWIHRRWKTPPELRDALPASGAAATLEES